MQFSPNGAHVTSERDNFLIALVDTSSDPESYVILHRCGTDVAKELSVPVGSIYVEVNGQQQGGYHLLKTVTIESTTSWRLALSEEAVARGMPAEISIKYVGTKALPPILQAAFKRLSKEAGTKPA